MEWVVVEEVTYHRLRLPGGVEMEFAHVAAAGQSFRMIWLSTFALQVPCHTKLLQGFDTAVHRKLVMTNWIRTVGWSTRTGLVLWWF